MAPPRVVVVVPAWNEESSIANVVAGARFHGANAIVVVDDGSQDATAIRAHAAGAITVSQVNAGYDAALCRGFVEAHKIGAALVVTMDADGQHDPSELPRVIAALDNGAAVVIGVRRKCARWAEGVYCCVARWLWGIQDPLTGLKGYRISIWQAHGGFDHVKSIGTQLAVFAARQGQPIAHVPIDIRTRASGPTRFGTGWRANMKILKAMLRVLLHSSPPLGPPTP